MKTKFLFLGIFLLALVFSIFAPEPVLAECVQVADSSDCPSGDIYYTCPDADGIKIHYCCEDGGGSVDFCCDESFPPTRNMHVFYDSTNIIGRTSVNCTFVDTLATGGTSSSSSTCLPGQVCIKNPLKAATLDQLIDSIIDFVFNIAIALAPLMLVIAGFYYVTAAGEPAKITTAQKIIKWTLIGLIIALLAKGLISMLKQALGPVL